MTFHRRRTPDHKPGLRVYAKHTALPRCSAASRRDHLDQPGPLTDRQANRKGVGGEVLAYVW